MHDFDAEESKGYNLLMIRDFLVQLKCELNAALQEMTNRHELDESIVKQLTPLVQKYDSTLMFLDAIEPGEEDEGRVKQAARELRSRQALLRQEQLERLDVLESLFVQAFEAGKYSLENDGQPVRTWTVDEILQDRA